MRDKAWPDQCSQGSMVDKEDKVDKVVKVA